MPQLDESLIKAAIRAGYEASMTLWDGYYTPKPSEYEAHITSAVDEIYTEFRGLRVE